MSSKSENINALESKNDNDKASSKGPTGINKRRHERQTVHWPACCKLGAQEWSVTIMDASNGGFGINKQLPLEVGTHLHITIEQIGVFNCKVAWTGSERSGLQLLSEQDDLSAEQEKELCDALMRAEGNRDRAITQPQIELLGAMIE